MDLHARIALAAAERIGSRGVGRLDRGPCGIGARA